MRIALLLLCLASALVPFAQPGGSARYAELDQAAAQIQARVIAWRRDFHQHPELGNQETRTATVIAAHLRRLGMSVKEGVGITGVVGVLQGGRPGPVIALRADMDALPITEATGLPFASTVRTTYNGQPVGVMHACGHDAHMAMLMGVAEILSQHRRELQGTVKFIFQPAEEGTPDGSIGGAELMVREGVLDSPRVDVVFGLHTQPQQPSGTLVYRPGGFMASVNDLKMVVHGHGAHGAYPWESVDPIVVAAQIISQLQTIVSRNVNLSENPAVVTIGAIHGGTRSNIIPDQVELFGTLRALSDRDEKLLIDRTRQVAIKTAEAAGATVEVIIPYTSHYPVTFNDSVLTARMLPSLQATAGPENVRLGPAVLSGEDFSFFQKKAPGLFLFLGVLAPGADPKKVSSQHTATFYLEESSLLLGVKTLLHLVVDYPRQGKNGG